MKRTVAALAAACLASTLVVGASARADTCTIKGTVERDRLLGTSGDDVICAGKGADEIVGRGGDDIIYAGAGADTVLGGVGVDVVISGIGPDVIDGGPDADEITGGPGLDEVLGGDGDDSLLGLGGADEVIGGLGNDVLSGGLGDDILDGGPGDDLLDGNEGIDVLDGGDGRDGCEPGEEGETQINCEDVQAPRLRELKFEPAVVDTSMSSQTVTVTARITDDLSGLSDGVGSSYYSTSRLLVVGPEGNSAHIYADFLPPSDDWGPGTQTSGDANDGTYEAEIVLPRFSAQGSWRVQWVNLQDEATNSRYYFKEDLEEAGFPTGIVQSGAGDSKPPELSALTVTPESTDTSQSSQRITVTAIMTDDLSGVANVMTYFRGPNQQSFHFQLWGTGEGTYVGTNDLPRYSQKGTWHLVELNARDQVGNGLWLDSYRLAERGLSRTFEQTGEDDVGSPQLVEFDFTPKQVNTSQGPQVIEVTARIQDSPAGLSEATVSFWGPGRTCTQTGCPEGHQDIWARFSANQRVSGTAADGVYRTTITLPQYSELGEWRIFWFSIKDAAGNELFLIEDNPYGDTFMSGRHGEVSALGFPTSFING